MLSAVIGKEFRWRIRGFASPDQKGDIGHPAEERILNLDPQKLLIQYLHFIHKLQQLLIQFLVHSPSILRHDTGRVRRGGIVSIHRRKRIYIGNHLITIHRSCINCSVAQIIKFSHYYISMRIMGTLATVRKIISQ